MPDRNLMLSGILFLYPLGRAVNTDFFATTFNRNVLKCQMSGSAGEEAIPPPWLFRLKSHMLMGLAPSLWNRLPL